jgi:hypothetical protein
VNVLSMTAFLILQAPTMAFDLFDYVANLQKLRLGPLAFPEDCRRSSATRRSGSSDGSPRLAAIRSTTYP